MQTIFNQIRSQFQYNPLFACGGGCGGSYYRGGCGYSAPSYGGCGGSRSYGGC